MPTYDSVLEFARKLLQNANINTYMMDADSLETFDIDLGLRQKLYGGKDIKAISRDFKENCCDNVLYFSQDRFHCRYTLFKLPDTAPPHYFLAGPYIFRQVDHSFFLKITQELSIPQELHKFLRYYYTQVPFVEYEDQLRSILLLLAAEVFGGSDRFRVEHKNFHKEIITGSYFATSAISLDEQKEIEERYQLEQELMQAVATGNLEKIEFFTSRENPFHLEQRFANQIRNAKNYLIVLNTLLRKAAQYGGVHPIYLDELSSRFARQIELITSDTEERRLNHEMLRKYCLLVKSHSLKGYSPIIQKIITHITLSLADDLSLKTLSGHFSISPTYLSALFKKETGTTLTDFVNRKRIENSVFLLNSTDLRIQTIAVSCGITDLNYFTRLFKKYMGYTPSEYRTMIMQK